MPLPARLGDECPRYVKFPDIEYTFEVFEIHYEFLDKYDMLFAKCENGYLLTSVSNQLETLGDELLPTI